MSEGVPAASTRFDVSLVELESELEALLVEYESLSLAWPKEPHAVARAEIGRKAEGALARIGELQNAIATTSAPQYGCGGFREGLTMRMTSLVFCPLRPF